MFLTSAIALASLALSEVVNYCHGVYVRMNAKKILEDAGIKAEEAERMASRF